MTTAPARYGLVCVYGHAMDDGYFNCPSCGAYRPSGCVTRGMTHQEQMVAIRAALDKLEPQARIHV